MSCKKPVINIADNLQAVRRRIHAAEQKYARPSGTVTLLAVSKTHPADIVRLAVSAGQREFAENYAREAVEKITELGPSGLSWHFIGPIQANKTRLIAAHFDWVHSIDRIRIAHRLSEARSPEMQPLNVCIQVNISGEQSKSGVAPGQVGALAADIATLPGLLLRGLMVIPAMQPDFASQRQSFRAARELLEKLNACGMSLDTLSMGMSNDLEAAIAEGATIVRIGTAIFGPRKR